MTVIRPFEELDTIQRWMLSVITHPDGVSAGISSPEAQCHIGASPETLELIIARSRQLTSVERLQIYANAYYARLIECMRDEFPALVYLLGEEAFGSFAFQYLQQFPPRSYTLAQLAAQFPRFLSETQPPSNASHGGAADWSDFLIDLAQLERTYSEVFDGPGPEAHGSLQAHDLKVVDPAKWPGARLVPVPSLRLLELRSPVHEFASAVRHGLEPVVPRPARTFLVLTRHQYLVRTRQASRLEFRALEALCDGGCVGDAVSLAAEHWSAGIDQLADHLRDRFYYWATEGYFARIDVC